MTTIPTSGVDPGQRLLNGPQTTGRDYRNLSPVQFRMRRENDVRIPLRDGTVPARRRVPAGHRPAGARPWSPRRRIPGRSRTLGLPAGIVEAGASDFWVPRGYAHVIVNLRGMCGSEGTYTSSTPRSASTSTTSWSGSPPSRGATDRSA